MKRVSMLLVLLIAAAVLFWFFPLFHIVPVESARAGSQQSGINVGELAETFWTERLVPSLEQAADAEAVLAAIRANPQQAREQYDRSAGIGRTAMYMLRGRGTIVSVEKNGVGVALAAGGNPDIVLQTGPLFRNTVRDVTGMLSASDYPNSQRFNDLSAELNGIVETAVIARVKREAQIGRTVEFAGCAEVLDLPADVEPLKLIPLDVRFE